MGESTSAAELLTSTQHIWVNVPMAGGVRIYLDQAEAYDAKVLDLPKGFTAVANIQIFNQSKLDADKPVKEYAKAIVTFPKDPTTELVSFDPPMIIILGNPEGVEKKIVRFALLLKKGPEKKWLVWDEKEETKDNLKKIFKKAGFEGDFLEGDPGILIVYKWPSGDPCVGH
jgi:hypothetical protein